MTITGLIYGHWDWDSTYNDCGFGDPTNFVSTYDG